MNRAEVRKRLLRANAMSDAPFLHFVEWAACGPKARLRTAKVERRSSAKSASAIAYILKEKPDLAVNRPGFGHIAFLVDDVLAAREAVLAAGGQPVGEVVTLTTATGSSASITGTQQTRRPGSILVRPHVPKMSGSFYKMDHLGCRMYRRPVTREIGPRRYVGRHFSGKV